MSTSLVLKKVVLAVPLTYFVFYHGSLCLVDLYRQPTETVLFVYHALVNHFNFSWFYALSLYGVITQELPIVAFFTMVQIFFTMVLFLLYLFCSVFKGSCDLNGTDFQTVIISVLLSVLAFLLFSELEENQSVVGRLKRFFRDI